MAAQSRHLGAELRTPKYMPHIVSSSKFLTDYCSHGSNPTTTTYKRDSDMDKLPQELVDHVCSFLENDDLKRILTLSSRFHIAAERCSGAFEKVTITEGNAQKFWSTYGGYRFNYLRCIKFKPTLPGLVDYPKSDEEWRARSCRDSRNELQEADEIFTKQIRYLFTTLKMLEDRVGASNWPRNIQLTIHTPTRKVLDKALYCRHRATVSWRIHLLLPELLPKVNIIRTLKFTNGRGGRDYLDDDMAQGRSSFRKLNLTAMLDLAGRLPFLEVLKCRVGGEDWNPHIQWESLSTNRFCHEFKGPYRDSRLGFAQIAEIIRLPNLKHADLDFVYPFTPVDFMDHRHPMPNLINPALYDRFSSSLRVLSYPLRRLAIQGVIDSTLFWPSDEDCNAPYWPNLEFLNVAFHLVTPSGAWYFRGPEPDSITQGFEIDSQHYPPFEKSAEDVVTHEEYDGAMDMEECEPAQFRVIPNETFIVPLLTAFAKAAATAMPSLQEAKVWSPLKMDPEFMRDTYHGFDCKTLTEKPEHRLAWGFRYVKPGVVPKRGWKYNREDGRCRPPPALHTSSRRFYWRVSRWRPDSELHDLFRKIGCTVHNQELVEYWEDESCGFGLVDRDEFGDSYRSQLDSPG